MSSQQHATSFQLCPYNKKKHNNIIWIQHVVYVFRCSWHIVLNVISKSGWPRYPVTTHPILGLASQIKSPRTYIIYEMSTILTFARDRQRVLWWDCCGFIFRSHISSLCQSDGSIRVCFAMVQVIIAAMHFCFYAEHCTSFAADARPTHIFV